MNLIKKNLSNALSFFISILLIIAFTLIGTISFKFITEKMEENIIEKNYIKAQMISKDITNIFENAKMYTEQMSMNRDIVQYLNNVKTRKDIRTDENYDYVYDYIVKIKESNPVHFLAWVANEKANFYGYSDFDIETENI